MQYVYFCVRPLLHNNVFKIHVLAWIISFLWLNSTLDMSQLIGIWVVITFWLLRKCYCEHSCVFFCRHMFSVLLGTRLGVELLGHMITLCLTLLKNCQTVSKAAALFFPPTVFESSSSLHSHPHLVLSVFNYSFPSGCKVITHYSFWFTFSWFSHSSIFSYAYWLFVYIL